MTRDLLGVVLRERAQLETCPVLKVFAGDGFRQLRVIVPRPYRPELGTPLALAVVAPFRARRAPVSASRLPAAGPKPVLVVPPRTEPAVASVRLVATTTHATEFAIAARTEFSAAAGPLAVIPSRTPESAVTLRARAVSRRQPALAARASLPAIGPLTALGRTTLAAPTVISIAVRAALSIARRVTLSVSVTPRAITPVAVLPARTIAQAATVTGRPVAARRPTLTFAVGATIAAARFATTTVVGATLLVVGPAFAVTTRTVVATAGGTPASAGRETASIVITARTPLAITARAVSPFAPRAVCPRATGVVARSSAVVATSRTIRPATRTAVLAVLT